MQDKRDDKKPLIIYLDDDNEVRKTYSYYTLINHWITFETGSNKLTLPFSRIIKIKEEKENDPD